MARKQEPIKPLYPLHHEYQASLKRFTDEATMLLNYCETLLSLGKLEGKAKEAMLERVLALKIAMFGDAP